MVGVFQGSWPLPCCRQAIVTCLSQCLLENVSDCAKSQVSLLKRCNWWESSRGIRGQERVPGWVWPSTMCTACGVLLKPASVCWLKRERKALEWTVHCLRTLCSGGKGVSGDPLPWFNHQDIGTHALFKENFQGLAVLEIHIVSSFNTLKRTKQPLNNCKCKMNRL